MLTHPTGEIVEIVGIDSNTNGHSCEEHHTCGCVLAEDTLIQLQKHQVYINGHEQSAVGVYWVSDVRCGSMPCRLSSLPPSQASQQTGRSSLSSYGGVL